MMRTSCVILFSRMDTKARRDVRSGSRREELSLMMSQKGRLCCKSRKLQGHEFFAKTLTEKKSPIRIASIALPKPPVSLARGDEAPHIFTRKPHLRPLEFLIPCAIRLLQHNRPEGEVHGCLLPRRLSGANRKYF